MNNELGLDLEMRFCEFMKTDLGYREATLRKLMKSSNKIKGVQVDIIAERSSDMGRTLKWVCLIFLILCAILFFVTFHYNMPYFSLLALFFDCLGVAIFFISYRYNVEHGWVECKNYKSEKADFDQMRIMILNAKDYKATNKKKCM